MIATGASIMYRNIVFPVTTNHQFILIEWILRSRNLIPDRDNDKLLWLEDILKRHLAIIPDTRARFLFLLGNRPQ